MILTNDSRSGDRNSSPILRYTTSNPLDCRLPDYYGDGFCDDENNNLECNWDGGDCCGDNIDTQFCSICDCLNGNVKLCTSENTCGHDEGDCNYDNECQPGLKCGTNNCPTSLPGFTTTIDCCYKNICMLLKLQVA